MRYDDVHWRKGAPEAPGNYLVFDRDRGRIEWAVITGVRPLTYRSSRVNGGRAWPFAAYLGPLRRSHNGR